MKFYSKNIFSYKTYPKLLEKSFSVEESQQKVVTTVVSFVKMMVLLLYRFSLCTLRLHFNRVLQLKRSTSASFFSTKTNVFVNHEIRSRMHIRLVLLKCLKGKTSRVISPTL